MARETDARIRAITGAIRLFRRFGYGGVPLSQLYQESGAPRGSFYFHFPGGKESLAVAAVTATAASVADLIRACAEEAPDASSFLLRLGERFGGALAPSDFKDGCPVAAVTSELSAVSEAARQAVSSAFALWVGEVTAGLRAHGVSAAQAARLALLVVSALEGAVLLARADAGAAPYETVVETLAGLVSQRE